MITEESLLLRSWEGRDSAGGWCNLNLLHHCVPLHKLCTQLGYLAVSQSQETRSQLIGDPLHYNSGYGAEDLALFFISLSPISLIHSCYWPFVEQQIHYITVLSDLPQSWMLL
jgi:hypothetical protein